VNINWTSPFWSVSLFVIYIITSCVGLYLIKAAEGWRAPAFAIGFILYAAGAIMWLVILRLLPLSLAFPIAAGSLIIGTMTTGAFFLSETITVWRMAGAFLIITGITLIAITR
jgi:multidrug transporter EmrE-like cation transporter